MPRSFHTFSFSLQNGAKPGTVAHAVIPVIRLGQEHICDFKASVVRERGPVQPELHSKISSTKQTSTRKKSILETKKCHILQNIFKIRFKKSTWWISAAEWSGKDSYHFRGPSGRQAGVVIAITGSQNAEMAPNPYVIMDPATETLSVLFKCAC